MDLGERFFLRGRGLDVQLGGAVKLVSMDGALPRSVGSIHVVKGSYSAYGQRLEIDRGILNFQGPVDNPGLNILALRKNQEVEAGVAITGTAQNPRVTLVSNPNVPASEKLSWLVLGHGIECSSGQDFSVLQAAAGALLAAGDSVTLQQHIAHAAGLEEVSLKGGGTLESTVLTLGKRLSSRAYLSYEHSLSGADTLVKINYTLGKHLSVRAQAGTTPALDLFYSLSFN
jgi:translocation and assembly module TamB